jgi:hypothetical protein
MYQSRQRSRRLARPLLLYYGRKISLIGNLQGPGITLQSWHINCDSVDLAKG